MPDKKTNRKLVTVAMLVAILLVAIDVTIVSTAMPKVVRDLNGLNLISWVFAIYTLTTSVTTPIYGKLADLFGRKKIFIIGVILFVGGSILSGVSQTMMQLIIFRAIQGIGAGAVMPITFTIIGDLYPGEQRAKMQGMFSAVWGIAGLLGPLVGGFLVDQISWRWIFFINLPVGMVSLLLIVACFHESFEQGKSHSIDYLGAITFTLGLSSLLYVLLNAGQAFAWNSAPVYALFAAFAIFMVTFGYLETKVSEPMLPPSLFRIPVIIVSNLVTLLASSVVIAVTVYLPIWIQTILEKSATSSGLTLMPMSLVWPLGAGLAGRYMYRIGSKLTAVIGTVLVSLSGIWLAALSLASPYWYFVGIMVVIGFGMGYALTPTTVLVQSAVGWGMRGAATASNMLMRSLGQTVGIAVFGTIFNNALSSEKTQSTSSSAVHTAMASGIHLVFVFVFFIGIVTLIVSLLLPSHQKVIAQQKQVAN
ncbi:MDR family MFS transporter [Sporolactobacillus laevolacticus]|uniref:MDR family MFS transporter n=1 Tax=Sporolactobacillus laevolacticus TaxID=33018 RepID=UPI0025B5A2E4|nr:MDR family MFS transporter [Sporolactobacillus laevolacticus]MDN3955952.1 MDR family MFS transporter [Sporolactobacillus laevolacticus]